MAKVERGVYEPSDEVRVFDGAEDEDDAEGSRLPLLIVLALLVLAMFGGLVWLAYTQGVARGRTETPVLAAAPGPERVAPANAGGSTVPYQGFKIYEQPAPADDDAQAAAPAPAATPAPAPAPEKLAQAAPPPAAAPPAPKPAPVVTPKPAPAAAPAPRPAITATAPPPKPVPQPAPKPVAVAKAPPPAPVKAAPVAPASTVATGGPRTLPGVAAPAPAPKPVAAPVKAAASGGLVLQIGAYKSQDDADAAWKTYKAKHAALLSGYGPDVQKADLGDKGTWYRLRIAGFADRDVASALCDRLKADGGGCFLGK